MLNAKVSHGFVIGDDGVVGWIVRCSERIHDGHSRKSPDRWSNLAGRSGNEDAVDAAFEQACDVVVLSNRVAADSAEHQVDV